MGKPWGRRRVMPSTYGYALAGRLRDGRFNTDNKLMEQAVRATTHGRKNPFKATARNDGGRLTKNALNLDTDKHPLYAAEAAQGYAKLLEQSGESLKELKSIVKRNVFSMNDHERMQAIDRIYTTLRENRSLVSYYTRKNISVSYVRAREKNDLASVKALYGNTASRYW